MCTPPPTYDQEISADLPGKQARKRGEMELKRRKIRKGKVENCKRKEDLFSFFFFSFPFHLSKPLKFVLGLPKWEFSTGKNHFTPGKKIRNVQ